MFFNFFLCYNIKLKKIIILIIFFETLFCFSNYIKQCSEFYQIPEELIKAIITVESSWDQNAISHKNAYGLMQITEPAYNHYRKLNPKWSKVWISNFDVVKKDWKANINVGCWYLKQVCYEFTGNWKCAITAYFWGLGNEKATDVYFEKVMLAIPYKIPAYEPGDSRNKTNN